MAKLKSRHAGKVDYENLGKPVLRWHRLVNTSGIQQLIFGYFSGAQWIGYAKNELDGAPCNHCGRDGVFGGRLRSHLCTAKWNGQALPCVTPHVCKGQPSMSWHGVSRWSAEEWRPGA